VRPLLFYCFCESKRIFKGPAAGPTHKCFVENQGKVAVCVRRESEYLESTRSAPGKFRQTHSLRMELCSARPRWHGAAPAGGLFPKIPRQKETGKRGNRERNPRLLESAIFSAYCPSAGKRFEKYVITIGRGLLKYAHDVMANKKLYNAPLCAHININGPLSPELRRKKQCVHQNACKLVSFAVGS
jgi:hypothetical protein